MNDRPTTTPRRPRRRPARASEPPRDSRWNPELDPALAERFSAARPAGKARCKEALQRELGLKARAKVPLLLYAGALDGAAAERLLDALPVLLKSAVQVLLLGAGEGSVADRAAELARQHEGRLVLRREDEETFLRRCLAGADVLLVPAAGFGATAWRGLRYGVVAVAPAGSEVPALLGAPPARRRRAEEAAVPLFLYRSESALALARAGQKAVDAFRDAVLWRRLRRAAMRVQGPEAAAPAAPVPVTMRSAVSPVMTLAETAHQTLEPAAAPQFPPTSEPSAPYIDWGPPPPQRYGEDAIALLVQSPRRLYGYWEISRPAGAPPLVARLVLHVDHGQQVLADAVPDIGEWWIDGEPGRRYRLELRAPSGTTLLESAAVRTPREAGSEHGEPRFVEARPAPRSGTAPAAPVPAAAGRAGAAPPAAPPSRAVARAPVAAPPPRAAAPPPVAGRRRTSAAADRRTAGVAPAPSADEAARPAPARAPAPGALPSSHERPRQGQGEDASPFGSSEHAPGRRS